MLDLEMKYSILYCWRINSIQHIGIGSYKVKANTGFFGGFYRFYPRKTGKVLSIRLGERVIFTTIKWNFKGA
jgi:hypothetical protein